MHAYCSHINISCAMCSYIHTCNVESWNTVILMVNILVLFLGVSDSRLCLVAFTAPAVTGSNLATHFWDTNANECLLLKGAAIVTSCGSFIHNMWARNKPQAFVLWRHKNKNIYIYLFSLHALWWTGDLSRVYPAFHPMTARTGYSTPQKDKRLRRCVCVCV